MTGAIIFCKRCLNEAGRLGNSANNFDAFKCPHCGEVVTYYYSVILMTVEHDFFCTLCGRDCPRFTNDCYGFQFPDKRKKFHPICKDCMALIFKIFNTNLEPISIHGFSRVIGFKCDKCGWFTKVGAEAANHRCPKE